MKNTKKRVAKAPDSSGATKSESLLMRLEPREKKGFTDAADLAGLPLTTWMRTRLREIATAELRKEDLPVAYLDS